MATRSGTAVRRCARRESSGSRDGWWRGQSRIVPGRQGRWSQHRQVRRLSAPGFDEANGCCSPCNSTQTKANQDSEQHDDAPVAVKTSPHVTEKQSPDPHSRVSKHGCSKREARQGCEQDNHRRSCCFPQSKNPSGTWSVPDEIQLHVSHSKPPSYAEYDLFLIDAAAIGKHDCQAGVERSEPAQTMLDSLKIEFGVREEPCTRKEGDLGSAM